MKAVRLDYKRKVVWYGYKSGSRGMRKDYLPVVNLFLRESLDLLGSRVEEVYLHFPEGMMKRGDLGIVMVVEHRGWDEEKLLRELIMRILKDESVLIDLLVVERSKWERWRDLGKPIVGEVEEGELIYLRSEGLR